MVLKMGIEKNLRIMINVLKKAFKLSQGKKISKHVVPIIYPLAKRIFAVAILLKVCESFLFRQGKKSLKPWVFSEFPEKRRPNEYCL